MSGSDVALEVDGPDVVDICAGRLSIDRALVQLRVLARGRVDGVDVDDGHLLVQNLRAGLHQFARFAVQTCALQKET